MRHPSAVRTLVSFEPAAVRLLPDGQKWVDFFSEVYNMYREYGPAPALAKFREQAFTGRDRELMARAPDAKNGEHVRANAIHRFEHELRQYPAADLDLDRLKAHAGQIVPAAGRDSGGYPAHQVSVELGKKLGRDVIELPGGHLGYVAQPAAFARELRRSLR